MRSSPKLKRDRQRVDTDPRPPRGLIAVALQLPMMEPANGNCVFVADFSAWRPRLGEANVMGFRGGPSANDAGPGGDEFAVFLVAQANGFRRNPSQARGKARGQDCRSRRDSVHRGEEGLAALTTDRQRANRASARLSKGPKTAPGKARSAQNALRHGLNVSILSDPLLTPQVEVIARKIAGPEAGAEALEFARRIAEAQVELHRVRNCRCRLI